VVLPKNLTEGKESIGWIRPPLGIITDTGSGQQFPIEKFPVAIGRSELANIRLSDKSVSKRHCQLEVADGEYRITDWASVNGSTLAPQSRLLKVGNVKLKLPPLNTLKLSPDRMFASVYGGKLSYRPDNLLLPARPTQTVTFPAPPRPDPKMPFPVISLIAPAILGLVMYLIMQNLTSIIFCALSPIIMLGNWIENRVSGRRKLKAAGQQFAVEQAEAQSKLQQLEAAEIQYWQNLIPYPLLAAHPQPINERLKRLTDSRKLFARRPEHANYFSIGVGIGPRLSVQPEHVIDQCPVVADLNALKRIGVSGPQYLPVLNALIAQLVCANSGLKLKIHHCNPSAEQLAVWKWLDNFEPSNPELTETSDLVYLATSDGKTAVRIYFAAAASDLPSDLDGRIDTERQRWLNFSTSEIIPLHHLFTFSAPESLALVDALGRIDRQLIESAANFPTLVTYLDVESQDLAADYQPITAYWQRHREQNRLLARIGRDADGAVELDLIEQGPHALIGGCTGSGKSEFLQSWILQMAINHSPADLNFLLIDYKGGSAFQNLTPLPHCVATITDLDERLVERMLTSLKAEIKLRERLLYEHGVKDLNAYRKLHASATPNAPSANLARLIVVVDEFATIAKDVPQFIDGVIDIAQRGRSLGIHLILATQRPTGVVNDNIRANVDLRIALRMNDPQESTDVIDRPDAAALSPLEKGRVLIRTNAQNLIQAQTLFVNAVTSPATRDANFQVHNLELTPTPEWEIATKQQRVIEQISPQDWEKLKDVNRMVDSINSASAHLQLSHPRKPWLPELPSYLSSQDVPGETPPESPNASHADWSPGPAADSPSDTIMVLDSPATQSYRLISRRAVAGNCLISGSQGVGKSELLKTIAVTLSASQHPPRIVIISPTVELKVLLDYNTVSDYLTFTDTEQLARLFSSIVQPSTASQLIVIIKDVNAFQTHFDKAEGWPLLNQFYAALQNASRGQVQFLLSTNRPSNLSSQIRSFVNTYFTLKLLNDVDYAALNVSNALQQGLNAKGPGAILFDHLIGQVIFYEPETIACLAEQSRAEHQPLPSIPRLTSNALTSVNDPYLAIRYDNLTKLTMPITGPIVVCGPRGSGKTTLIQTLQQLYRLSRPQPTHPLQVIPDLAEIETLEQDEQVANTIRQTVKLGHPLIVEWTIGSASQCWQCLQTLKNADMYLALNCRELDLQILGVDLPTTPAQRRPDFIPGRGYIVTRQLTELVQFAHFPPPSP
jgi:energy-coupling factor transporter ATP-binding protein EcfA2